MSDFGLVPIIQARSGSIPRPLTFCLLYRLPAAASGMSARRLPALERGHSAGLPGPEPYAVGFYDPEIPSGQSRLQGRDNPERQSEDRVLILSFQPQDDNPGVR
jgi:hypothetical protein